MDLSSTVAWSFPVAGCLLAALYGHGRAEAGAQSIWGSALWVAIVSGVLLTFVQVVLHGACIGARWCADQGDVNMSYWFQSFMAIPLYWLVACSVWKIKQ